MPKFRVSWKEAKLPEVNVANNPYVQNARSYIPSPEVLFPKVDEETQKWAEGVAQQQEEIMNNFGFNNQQNSTPNPFESFTNQMMHSAEILGQIFNNAANNYNYYEVD